MIEAGYAGLFLTAFAAATILPFSSEAVLTGMIAAGTFDIVWLLFAASTGNTLGACVNWGVGRFLLRFRDSRWFPIRQQTLARVQGWFGRYGLWSLLLAWVPVIGDPITVAAGVLRVRFWIFLVLVAVAKTGRYFVVLGLYDALFG